MPDYRSIITSLVNEHFRLEAAIYEVEEDLLLRDMRRFVREEIESGKPSWCRACRSEGAKEED
jgi:hypothetical protein